MFVVGAYLCAIVRYHDDGFSHYLFFAGFIALNVVVMLTQAVTPISALDTTPAVLNGLFVSVCIVANLAFEEIGLDLHVVAVVAVVLLVRRPRGLVPHYFGVAYVVGVVATFAIKSIMGA